MLTNFINAVIEYFKHDSTWQGVIVGLTALGVHFSPDLQAAIVTAGAAIFAAFQIFIADRNVDKNAPAVTPPAA